MRKLIPMLILAIILSSCSLNRTTTASDDKNSDLALLGQAPELTNETWINAEQPLRLADLRGKVVLLEMWTFGCVNCQRVVPYLTSWHQEYADQGLVIIANHYPEFPYERDLDKLRDAVQGLGIEFPVTQDNQGETWRAYHSQYWPTVYLIDKQGLIRYRHIGEGSYRETEAAIRALLAEGTP